MADPAAWYEANAAAVSAQYEEVSGPAVHAWLLDLLPSPLTLDMRRKLAEEDRRMQTSTAAWLHRSGGLICGYICQLPPNRCFARSPWH